MNLDKQVFLFREFLKKHGVFSDFIANFNNYQGTSYSSISEFFIKTTCSCDQWLNYAFCWNDTLQGHNYWSKLHDDWKEFCFECLLVSY